MLEFQLFRVKVFFPSQLPLLAPLPSRPELLKQAIQDLPSVESRRGMVWHIGNIEILDDAGLYFRVGRTTTTTVEVFDEGKFQDQTFESAPYTHVLFDLNLEVCAIAKKPRLSPSTTGIATQFAKLLQESRSATEVQATFEINPIADPEDFISSLKHAYAISRFAVWFSQPNPFDVNADFIRPAQRLVKESNSHQGKTELKGQNLNPAVLEDIARSAASTGDDAAAWLKTARNQRSVRKRLKGSSVNMPEEHVDDAETRKSFLAKMRELYGKIRRGDEAT